MNPFRLASILCIIACTSAGWWLLSGVVSYRTQHVAESLNNQVSNVWGPELEQPHPSAWFAAKEGPPESRSDTVEASLSNINVTIDSDPRKRGLLWHRTYGVQFQAAYNFTNPGAEPRTLEVKMHLPSQLVSLRDFRFDLSSPSSAAADENTGAGASRAGGLPVVPHDGFMTARIDLPAKGAAELNVTYTCRGTNSWRYKFPSGGRIQGFILTMNTDFTGINFPAGTGSPTLQEINDQNHCKLVWDFNDMIAAQGIGMEMPSPLNAGPVASSIASWAPLSLVLFFGVVLLVSIMRGINLHPVHYLFTAAGLFAFPLLFAYSVDVLDVHASFLLAAGVSVIMVCGYLWAVGGKLIFRTALAAHLSYVVLFAYSFFHKGATGLVLIIIGIVTLGALMAVTARVNWSEKLSAISPKLA